MFNRIFVVLVLMTVMFPLSASAERLWRVDGLQDPESALYDAKRKQIIVSNIVGPFGFPDGNGYLSLVSPEGKIIKKQWVTGFDGPTGMAILGDQLLVVDIQQLRIVDIAKGKITKSIKIAGSALLNDVTAGKDSAWVTDFMGHSIFQYKDGKVSLWLKDEKLSHPNGIMFDGKRLLVGSWGKGLRPNFSTEVPGAILAVDVASKAISVVKGAEKVGNLDGVAKTGDTIVVSDWISGDLYTMKEGEPVKKLKTVAPGLADLSVHGKTVYVAISRNGGLEAHSLP